MKAIITSLKFARLRFADRAIAHLYMIALSLGYISAGRLLAAFQVSSFVWVGTLGILLYLAKAGADAIATPLELPTTICRL